MIQVKTVLSNILVVICFKGFWSSAQWIHDFQIHRPYQKPKIKSVVVNNDDRSKISVQNQSTLSFSVHNKYNLFNAKYFSPKLTPKNIPENILYSNSNKESNKALKKLNKVWRRVTELQLGDRQYVLDISS